MKKILSLLSLVMLFALAANADNYRRTWDFTKGWSESTKAMLADDATHWTPQGTGYRNTKMTAGTAQVWVNGEAQNIPELEGLTLGGLASAAHVQIVTTYSGVKDVNCLWINGKTSADNISFTVPAGENVKIGYCSHSGTEARGFSVSSGFADATGATKFTSVGDGTIHEVELINSNDGDATLKLSSTSGHHIYYIIIGEGDAPSSSKIGIVYSAQAGKSLEELAIYSALNGTEGITLEGINIDDTNPTADQLKAYDAIILDNSLPVDADLVAALKPCVQWQPTLNLNAPLAAAFGYGTLVTSETNNPLIDNIKKSWFASLIKDELAGETSENSGKYTYTVNEGVISGLNLAEGTHSAETALASTAITDGQDDAGNDIFVETGTFNYVHNLGYNEYCFYGTDGSALSEASVSALKSIVDELVSSKSDVKQCTKPSIKGIYKEQLSKVVLSDVVKGATIYYTTDGTEPTEASAVYTDTLTFTEEATLKAVAISDGYTLSEANSMDIKLFHQAKTPVITVANGGDYNPATVSLSSDEDVTIWYNFTGSTDTLSSSKYTEPITLKVSAPITAFAIGNEEAALVQSELAQQDITANAKKTRRNQLAHFNASGWNTLANLAINGVTMTAWTNSSYYFSWGKTARQTYTNSEDPMTDDDGNPLVDDSGDMIYDKVYYTPDTTTCSTDSVWKLVSNGQVMIYQSNTLSANIGNFGGYNPEKAEDYIEPKLPTNGDVQFGSAASGDPCTASIMSANKYQGPFNVVSYVANVNGDKTTGVGKPCKVAIQVSADGKTWETLGDTLSTASVFRNYKKFEESYDGTDAVYVRVASISGSSQAVHDIYVFNNPDEEPQERLKGDVNGDGSVNIADVNAVITVMCGGEANPYADVNGDGEVNIADVNAVITIMCGGTGAEE